MPSAIRRLACVVLLLASTGAAEAQTAASSPTSIVVTEGEAIIRRAPDRAWLTMATETREPRAADARRRGAEAMTALQNALRGAGVPSDAIRTMAFSLTPEMDWNNGRGTVRGYLMRNQIEVRVDDLDRIGEILEAANSSRTTSVSVTGPRFDIKNRADAESEALRQAVRVATARAEAMAAGARRTLGPLVRLEERGQLAGPEPFMKTMAMRADVVETPVNPGEIEVRGLVSVTFELR